MMAFVVFADGVWESALRGGLRGAIVGAIAGALAALCLWAYRTLKNRRQQPTDRNNRDEDAAEEDRRR
jgi:hypothetical protein